MPTYSSFVLVVAFLIKVVITGVDVFWTATTLCTYLNFALVFHIEEDFPVYRRLLEIENFLVYFEKLYILRHSTVQELWNTSLSENWKNLIQSCLEDTNVSFPLEESEIEIFRNASWVMKNMKCKPEMCVTKNRGHLFLWLQKTQNAIVLPVM
ncbi:hypothetical protein TNCT_383621 [Trichonephila clavata]|uniref:Uncharacterized protein n=1 Tax=Trichonephila clavata TaxID=2740835 RepID=A0A8X6GTT4_TRICU|nr:hypothetical protein TNCT_383621 [Trichonephila clavata]